MYSLGMNVILTVVGYYYINVWLIFFYIDLLFRGIGHFGMAVSARKYLGAAGISI